MSKIRRPIRRGSLPRTKGSPGGSGPGAETLEGEAARRLAGSKAESVVRHCLYAIGTGTWQAGQRLPSLRQAQEHWGVNHLTVLRAYRELCALGLVRAAPRSGYFVAERTANRQVLRVRNELSGIYEDVQRRLARLQGEPGVGPLSELGAFRYLAQLAELRVRHRPECAFVECTDWQASGHAREVERRLGMPCLAFTTAELPDRLSDAESDGLRYLLTTSFHRGEVTRLARRRELAVCSAPIGLHPDMLRRIAGAARAGTDFLFLALETDLARDVSRDVRGRIGRTTGRFRGAGTGPTAVDEVVESHLAGDEDRRIVLSPSLWTALDDRWHGDGRVWPLEYHIDEAAWPEIGATLGLPVNG